MTHVEQAHVDAVGKAADLYGRIKTDSTQCGHSANVRMNLHLNGNVLSISQITLDFLILRHPIEHPPTQAEVDMWVDDNHQRWPVYLLEGISAAKDRTKIAKSARQPAIAQPWSQWNSTKAVLL